MKIDDNGTYTYVLFDNGTYAYVLFDSIPEYVIGKYIIDNNIPNGLESNELHSTLLYSRKYCPNYKAFGQYTPPFIGIPDELEIWNTNPIDGLPLNCLVLTYTCPELVNRHYDLMHEHDATFDFPLYQPHITLSYDIGDFDISVLPNIKDYISMIVVVDEHQGNLD